MTERYYTQRQIRDALVAAGAYHEPDPKKIPGEADYLAAIAMAETPMFDKPGYSNFDRLGDLERVGQDAGGGKHWGPSVTSFQIRTIQEESGWHNFRDREFITASLGNAAWAAREIARRSGLTAWTTFNNGRAAAYLQEFFPPPPGIYLVVSGDTMYRIDAKLGLPRGTMMKWNPDVNPRQLWSGRQLQLGYQELIPVAGDTLHRLMKVAGWPGDIPDSEYRRVAEFAGIPPTFTIYPGRTYKILKPGYYV